MEDKKQTPEDIYNYIRNNPAKQIKSVEMIENYAELLREDIESVHKFLDEYNIPRKDSLGEFSMIGRIRKLVLKADSNFFG